MPWIIGFTVIAFAATIILLSDKTPLKKKTREKYLNELNEFLEGKLAALEDYRNSYHISFSYKEREFEFLDIENEGFKGSTYKGYLRTKTKSKLIINFTEKARTTIRTDIVKASEISKETISTVDVPRNLKMFNIYTNDIRKTNKLFHDHKFLDALTKYKHKNDRSCPVIPVKIQEGFLALEFYSDVTRKPSLYDIRHNVTEIDSYLDNLIVLVGAIESSK